MNRKETLIFDDAVHDLYKIGASLVLCTNVPNPIVSKLPASTSRRTLRMILVEIEKAEDKSKALAMELKSAIEQLNNLERCKNDINQPSNDNPNTL